MRYQSFISREMVVVMVACVSLGGALGVGASSYLYGLKSSVLAAELGHKTQRLSLLETLLAQVSRGSTSQNLSLAQPAPLPPLSPAPASLPALASAPVAAPAPVPAKVAARSALPAEGAPPRPAARLAAAVSASQSAPPAPVTGSEIRAALDNGNVEGVSAGKAGVKTLLANGVLMSNGSMVRVGDRFPSGERLLKVDPENGRVVTSERQMLLFFGKE